MRINNQSMSRVLVLILAVLGLNLANAQRTISGTVADSETNDPLIGASILIVGTSTGTITDLDGRFSLVATPGDVLRVSYTGYQPQDVPVTNQTEYFIGLLAGKFLEEVVVIGYGTQGKKDVTGAVAQVTSKDMNQGAITNPLQQISGRAAGVSVTQIGSEPGANPGVRIRGITSLIGGNDPLVVVDGIQGNLDLLKQVPPSEIESVDVLKDASATAIYGSRGAPGVIIVTTKKNKEGRVAVEYSGTMSIDVLANKLEMLSAEEWREQAQIWGVPPVADHGGDTDWYDLLTQTGNTQNHTISMGGGAANFSYRASVTGVLQRGIVINSNSNNYIGRIQATQKALNNRLALTVNLNSGIRKNIWSPTGVGRAAFRSNLISNAYVSKPTDPIYAEDGSYFYDPAVFQYINPYAVAETVANESETHNLFGSFRADLTLLKGLTAGWFGSWRKVDDTGGYYAPTGSTLPDAIDYQGIGTVRTSLEDEKLMDVSLDYEKDFYRHQIKVLGVYEWQNQTYQGNFTRGRGFISDITTFNALQLGSISEVLPGDISSYKNDRTLISFLGRLNYSYADKYLLTASFRRDGSSVFGTNHKWGTFPSVSLAWRISEEPWMQNLEFISYLKLRAGYGVTGNQQGLYPQNSLQLVGASGTVFFNGGLITNFAVTQNSNDDLRWETRYQTNLGMDFELFRGRLTGAFDVFRATTKNLLFYYTVPQPPYPFGSVVANVGSLKNEGIELTLNGFIVDMKDLEIALGGNVSLLRNEVLTLSGSINDIPVNTDYVGMGYNAYLIEGQPIGAIHILRHTGKNESTNEETVEDVDGNGLIDQGDRSPDRYFAGSVLPTYTFGIVPSIRYKNLDLSMLWRGSGGNKIYNSIKSSFSYFENLGKSNLLKSAVETGLFTSKYGSDLWLEDGDFVRFDNLTIGYTFKPGSIKHIQTLRISLTGNNLAVFTKYTGLDPELNVSGGNGSGGDAGIYPRTRNYALGLNVSF